jgi:hypothetical protein
VNLRQLQHHVQILVFIVVVASHLGVHGHGWPQTQRQGRMCAARGGPGSGCDAVEPPPPLLRTMLCGICREPSHDAVYVQGQYQKSHVPLQRAESQNRTTMWQRPQARD